MRNTHTLLSVERGSDQDTKRKKTREGHSQSVKDKCRDKSELQKNEKVQFRDTHFLLCMEGRKVRTQK